MKTIYFVRHGESESNINGLISGAEDDVRLTPSGIAQAKKTGQDLKDKNIQLIVCSPMIRALETARCIAKEIGFKPEQIVTTALFIERSYGIYSGRPSDKFRNDYASGKVHKSVETEEQMYHRFKRALAWLSRLKEDRIVVVSHGGASRAIRVIKNDLHHSEMYKLDSFGNAEIYEFNL